MTVYPAYNGAYANVGQNTGIRATWDSQGIAPPTPFWIAQTFPNQIWIQGGYYPPGWFYQVWDRTRGLKLAGTTSNKAITPGVHTFEISAQGKRWRVLIDGKSIGNYGVGASVGSGDFLLTNEFSNGTERALFRDAAALINGVWVPAPVGSSYLSGLPALGIAGNLQDAALPAGTIRIGGTAGVVSDTLLWGTET